MSTPTPEQLQLDAQQQLRHLLTLENLPPQILHALLDRAQSCVRRPGEPVVMSDTLRGKTIANLFFEASTRTRVSFELAARRLGAEVVNLDLDLSSASKGETVLDTLETLAAMNIDAFVVRHRDDGIQAMLASRMAPHIAIINAGESHLNHPTQGLLDALTIRQHKPDFENLKVAIVGDIRHSRVARSAIHALRILGTNDIRLIAPEEFQPHDLQDCTITDDMPKGIRDCDVIMMLRVQKERIASGGLPDMDAYVRKYRLDAAMLARARNDAIVMHPGPMNRGIEISNEVADGPQSVIRQQVNNGVAIRMAVIETLLGRNMK